MPVRKSGTRLLAQQTGLLLYKNWLFAKRNGYSTFWQVCSAACFVIVMAGLRHVLLNAHVVRTELLHPNSTGGIPRCKPWGDATSCVTLAYAPSGVPEVERMMKDVARNNGFRINTHVDGYDVFACDRSRPLDYCNMRDAQINGELPDILGWPSEHDLRAAMLQMRNTTWAGVVIEPEPLVHDRRLNYTVVYNATCPRPSNNHNTMWLSCVRFSDAPYFITHHIDSVFLNHTAAQSQECIKTGRGCQVETNASRQWVLMDTLRTRKLSRIQDAIVGAAGLLFFFTGLSVNFLMLLYQLVGEKENGLRQGMWVMGLRDTSHWLSWTITSFISSTVCLALMIVAGLVLDISYIANVSMSVHLAVFGSSLLSFCLAMMSFTMCLSVFYKRSRSCVSSGLVIIVVGVVFFVLFEAQVLYLLWPKINKPHDSPSWLLPVFSVFPWFHLAKASNDIFTTLLIWESGNIPDFNGPSDGIFTWRFMHHGLDTFFETAVPPPIRSVYYMLFLALVYALATVYLDMVVDDSHGVRAHWAFPFSAAYWRGARKPAGFAAASVVGSGGGVDDDDDDDDIEEDDGGIAAACASPLLAHGDDSGDVVIEDLHVTYQARRSLKQMLQCNADPAANVNAVNGLNLRVRKGELVCLLGQNGAGKSTTINVLLGLIQPRSGTLRILGKEASEHAAIRPYIGLCPQHDMLWLELTAYEHLAIFATLKRVPNAEQEEMIDAILGDVALLHVKHDLVRTFSGGMKRRLSVAMACIANPKLIIMDEPTTGMDPISRREVWDLLRRLKHDRTFLFTTHSMEEAEYVGDTIAIMAYGRLRCQGTSIHLKSEYGAGYLLHAVVEPEHAQEFRHMVKSHLPDAHNVATTSTTTSYSIPLTSASQLPAFFARLDAVTKHDAKERAPAADAQPVVSAEAATCEDTMPAEQGQEAGQAGSAKAMVHDWSIAHSTLEEVFLTITHQAQTEHGERPESVRSSRSRLSRTSAGA